MDGARSAGSAFAIVTTAKTARIPTTMNTTRLDTRATNVDPATFNAVIATTSSTANALTPATEPPATLSLA